MPSTKVTFRCRINPTDKKKVVILVVVMPTDKGAIREVPDPKSDIWYYTIILSGDGNISPFMGELDMRVIAKTLKKVVDIAGID